MRITTKTTIERPAAEVWQLLGPGFGQAAVWASSIEDSRVVGKAQLAGAPGRARECRVAVPGVERLVEELTAYDDASMSLTYVLADGMQQVARSARNTWRVIPVGADSAELRIEAEVDLNPVGCALSLVLRPYLLAMGQRNADDFRAYAETGVPSVRKRRQQTGVGSLADLVLANAVFTCACGMALLLLPGWWAGHAGDVTPSPIRLIGGLLLGYAAVLGWLWKRGPGAQSGRLLAMLDAGWVMGTAVMLALAGHAFTLIGVLATTATSAVVGLFGWAQWRASRRIRELTLANHGVGSVGAGNDGSRSRSRAAST